MGSIYKGCEGEIPHFSLVFFLSLLFPNENALSSLIFFSDGEGWSVGIPARWPASYRGGAAAPEIKSSFFVFFFVLSLLLHFLKPLLNLEITRTTDPNLDLQKKK